MLDLDDFKIVNDGLGHSAGDELLRHVARRLRSAVREQDLCAQLGGDEFAVLLTGPEQDALAIAQRLVDLVAAPVSLRGQVTHVGVSVGVAHPAPGATADELAQHADVAMYAAKAKGKNRVQVFNPTLLQEDTGPGFAADTWAVAIDRGGRGPSHRSGRRSAGAAGDRRGGRSVVTSRSS